MTSLSFLVDSAQDAKFRSEVRSWMAGNLPDELRGWSTRPPRDMIQPWHHKLFEKGISTKKQREEGGVIIGILNDVDDYRKEYCTTENSILIGQILLDK